MCPFSVLTVHLLQLFSLQVEIINSFLFNGSLVDVIRLILTMLLHSYNEIKLMHYN